MKNISNIFNCKPMDEMETHIFLRSKSYAQFFTMATLIIWVLYDIIHAAMSYDYKSNILPCLIILGSYCIESISRQILTKHATQDDEEYVKEQKDKRPEQLLTTTLLLVLVAAIAVFAAAILRYVFFVAGVLK